MEVCPHAVYTLEDRKVRLVRQENCMECGACAQNCQTGALTVEAGVGCAAALIQGALRGTEPSCGCTKDSCC